MKVNLEKLIRNLLRLYYEVLGEDPAYFQLHGGFFLVGRYLLAVKLQINRPKHSMSCFMGNDVVLGAYGIFVMRSEIYGLE
ncbi:hypothetical protein [Porphyromonas endodontalis]|jgi:hypothetical protein|uniref:hypothetical protein n=1 Tax=Porphyromonas endodontalis TaxID=28124 RepID=UPI00058F90A4|nr:hypothetical protein [Porphyromonas endodontalis]UBH64021.1 hypothetical protein LA319_05585 [Porphyromonas endodontalis]SUB67719.1 Uncharacterised protein [Porphyromonas endodontalis]